MVWKRLWHKIRGVSSEEFLRRKQGEALDIFFDAMRGKYSEEEYLAYLVKDTNWNMDKDVLKKCIRQGLNIPVEGTMKIIQKLKGKYRLILLSDHMREWMDYILENNRQISIFDKKYFSYEYGMLKTDEGCFEHIIKDLKILPNETVFIDDCKENVAMARNVGIEGILFSGAKDLEIELKKRGILE